MISAALMQLLDGPHPYVFLPPERSTWLRRGWVTKSHSHTEGTMLRLTDRGEAVAKRTQALQAALRRHPDLLLALDSGSTFGLLVDPGSSVPRERGERRA